MQQHEGIITGFGDTALWYQAQLPAEPVADVVLVHGYAEHSTRYQHVITALVNAGYAVWAQDHRGHGRSEGPRATVERVDDLVVDVSEFVRFVQGQNQQRAVFMFGHSMGGLISTLYALDYAHRIQGLILSSPGFDLDHTAPKPLLAVASIISALLPHVPASPFDISGISRDAAVRDAYINDPLNYIGSVKARMGYELIQATRIVKKRAHQLEVPVLCIVGEQDPIANPFGTVDVFSRFSSRHKTMHRFPQAYHEVLNEPEQAEAIELIIQWLDDHTSSAT